MKNRFRGGFLSYIINTIVVLSVFSFLNFKIRPT